MDIYVSQLVWLVLLAFFLALEALTVAFVCIWFAAGALAALGVALVLPNGPGVGVQAAVFLVVSALCVMAVRPAVRRLTGNRRVPTNADASIGKAAYITAGISPGHFGRVKLEGLEWTAKSAVPLPAGIWCRVDAIEGVKLVVSPFQGPAG